MWIFKTPIQDFLKIYFPGILGLILIFFSEQEQTNVLFYFFIFHIVDVGHVYSTMLRTIFDRNERTREFKTIVVPVLIGLISFFWLFFKVPYFWSFVVYFTVFHNLRQGWGIVRWYEKKNSSYHQNEIIYYILTIVPFILLHLRTAKINLIYYSQTDYVEFKFLKQNLDVSLLNQNLHLDNVFFVLFYFLYILTLIYWIFKEIRFALKNRLEYNRIFAMTYFAMVYGYSFLYATSSMQIFTILILSHGIPYLFIMNKLMNQKYSNFNKNMIFISLIVIIGAILNLLLEDFYLESIFNYTKADISFMEYLLTLAYITPILAHFVWDMYLWKNTHPDSVRLYSNE